MKLFYTILISVFCISQSFAQQKLHFRLTETNQFFNNGFLETAPISKKFNSLILKDFSNWKSGLSLNAHYPNLLTGTSYKPTIASGLSIFGKSSTATTIAVIDETTPIAECTFIPTVNSLSATDICPGTSVILSTQTGTGYTYQWLLNDEIIPNAHYSSYAAYQEGEYAVIVRNRNCKGESVPILVTVKDATFFNPLQDTVKQCGGNVTLDAGNDFYEYSWNNGQATQTIIAVYTGNYIVTTTSTNGCLLKDSCFVSLINEQINQSSNSICNGSGVELYVVGNNTAGTPQPLYCSWSNGSTSNPLNVFPSQNLNYFVDISNGYGSCRDSVNINVNQPTSSIKQASACGSYLWNETTYTQSGVYEFTTTNSTGCDSLITLYLTINEPAISIINQTVCDSFSWYGETYTTSGIYEHFISNGSLCDNIEQLNLIVNHSTESTIYESSCGSYVWNNQTYTASGTYTFTSTNASGCDSIATLILTINNPTYSVTNISADYLYNWNNQTYSVSGTYVFVSNNSNGCDSIALLVLTLSGRLDCTIIASSTTICEGQSVTLSVPEVIIPPSTGTSSRTNSIGIDNSIGSNFNYLWSTGENTTIINVSPSFTTTYTVTISDGIDSCTNSITIFVNHSSASTEEITSCGSYTWNGEVYDHSGSYIFTTTNAAGCDSVTTLNLIVNQSSTSTEEITSCGSYTWNGEVYNHSGSYIFTTTNAAGCDSVATLNLIVNQASTSIEEITSCGSYTWNGEVYNHSGSYIFTTTNAAGCDSVATLNLLIQSLSVIPDAIASSRNSLNAGEAVVLSVIGGSLGDGAVWNWYTGYCGGTLVGTGNQISVLPLMNTTYYVRAEGTCNNTECVSVSISVNTCGATGITSNASNNVICNGSSVVLSVQGTPGLGGNWNWYKNGCGVGCVIGTGSSITVSTRVTTTYYVMSVGGQCGTTTCQSITIYVNDAPHRPAAINGPITVTCNSHSVVYSVIPVAGATSYTWTVPTGSTIISGQGTSSIEVNFTRVINHNGHCNSNSICVKANNECGSSCATCISISTDMHGTHFEHEEDRSFGNNSFANLIPEIKTWPVPATSYLIIDAGAIQPVKIEIVDRLGKIVFNSLWKNKVDVSNLASGYYFLRVYSRTGVKTKQVEVIR